MPLRDAPDAESIPAAHWLAPVSLAEAMSAGLAPAELAVEAYANAGRWVVQCPDCNGAQLACRTDPRFMCNECANVGAAGLWRSVVWSEETDEVEAVLSVRPFANQNWEPGELVTDLAAENVDHDLPPVLEQVVLP